MDEDTAVVIILPCRNSGIHLRPAIHSILSNTEYNNWKLYLIESESTDGTAELCDEFQKLYANKIKVFHTKKEGITKAINFGIRQTTNEDIYLTQDDVIIPKLYGRDWLTILNGISKGVNVGAVTTINGGGISGQDYIEGFKWTGTWSLYIPRKTIESIGLLDENFSPGPGDDIDYSFRIFNQGLIIPEANFWVDHHRQTENFNDNIEFEKIRNAGYFRKKHNFNPSWESFDFDGEKYLLDSRTRKTGGCFDKERVDDVNLCKKIKELTKDFDWDDVMIDAGANTGFISLMLQKGVSFAVEVNPDVMEILQINAYLNNKLGKTVIYPVLCALDNDIKPYQIEKGWHEGLTHISIVKESNLKTHTLDELFFNKGLKIKLIKIDVEGIEMNVLEGAQNILKTNSPILIVENAPQDLSKFGYKFLTSIGINSIFVKQ